MTKEYGRMHFRLSVEEKEIIKQVIKRRGYTDMTAWLRQHIEADAIACGLVELSEEDKVLKSFGKAVVDAE